MQPFLAVDIGASSGRLMLGTLDNDSVTLKALHRFDNGMTRVQGRCHWNIYHLFNEVTAGIKKAAGQGLVPQSIGIDTWGVDYGLLDAAGHLLDLPYAYRDQRTDTAMEEVFDLISKERLYYKTGIQFLPFNTIFQLHAAVRDGLPIMAIAQDLLFMPDLLNYLLSGVKKTEFTMATTSQLYNPNLKSWDPDLFEAIGVHRDLMQPIVPPGTVIGELSHGMEMETGLPGIPLTAVGSHDTASAIAALPAQDDKFAYISSGTWSLMGIECREPIISPASLAYNVTNEGGVDNTFRVLKNIMGLWLIQECQRSWNDIGIRYTFSELTHMAAACEPFKCLINPDHPTLLHPDHMPAAIARLTRDAQEPEPETPGETARCIFESLAYRYRQTLDELNRLSERAIERIHIIGGGSQNDLLCQFTADATGLPVVAGPVEGTALGNIMVQAMALGAVASLTETRAIVRNSIAFRALTPQNPSRWDRHYQRFLDICGR